MKTSNHSPMGLKLKTGVAAFAVAVGGMFSTGNVYANTAAGEVLTNSASISYSDAAGSGSYNDADSVNVTVDHLPSVAWGSAPGSGQTIDASTGLANPYYAITLTNTGNGADSYSITDTPTGLPACAGTLGAHSFSAPAQDLGGTVTLGGSAGGATTITVPDDGSADGVTRGIANLETIVIGSDVVAVSGIVEGVPAGTTTITFAPALTAPVLAGVQVGERVDYVFGATGAAGTLTGAASCVYTHSLAALGSTETGGNTAGSDTVTGWATTVESSELTVTKYVRNDTDTGKNPVFNGATDITYLGVEYYAAGVSGNTLQTLTYLVVISNDSGGNTTDVRFSDSMPNFTTYTPGSIRVDTDGNETWDQSIGVPGPGLESEGAGDGIVVVSGNNITVYAGSGGTDASGSEDGGDITDSSTAPLNKSAVIYSVQID